MPMLLSLLVTSNASWPALFTCVYWVPLLGRGRVGRRSGVRGGIIVWTLDRRRPDGEARTGSEGRGAGEVQDAEPAPRGGPGCGVRVRGALRCCRSGAGEVRDGAPGRGGGDRGERRRALVRVLAAVLLQRRGGVGRWRTAGAGAGQARSAAGPQAQRPGPRSSGGAAGGRPDPTLRSVELAQAVADRFGTRVHPRSVERALARRESARSSKSG